MAFALAAAAAWLVVANARTPSMRAAPHRSFLVRDDAFVKDGEAFVVRSGSVHYSRVPTARAPERKFNPLVSASLCRRDWSRLCSARQGGTRPQSDAAEIRWSSARRVRPRSKIIEDGRARRYWRDRLLRLQALGLNTLTTYVPWNFHEEVEGNFTFDDNRDLGAFLDLANELGLVVLLRAGPYMCGEWDLGGFPAWLLAKENVNALGGTKGRGDAAAPT